VDSRVYATEARALPSAVKADQSYSLGLKETSLLGCPRSP